MTSVLSIQLRARRSKNVPHLHDFAASLASSPPPEAAPAPMAASSEAAPAPMAASSEAAPAPMAASSEAAPAPMAPLDLCDVIGCDVADGRAIYRNGRRA